MANDETKAPPGACDCHMHVYEPGYPLAPTALAAAPPGPLSEYLKIRDRLGLTRAVVVQPTAYGADNSCTLAAIAALGASARGVAMVTGEETDGELERLAQGGITGFRFRTFPGGVLPWERLDRMAARAQELGWHTDIEMDGRTLPEHEAAFARLPGTLGDRSHRQVPRAGAARSSGGRRADAADRQRPHLCEDHLAVRFIAFGPAGLRRPRAARREAGACRTGPADLGDQLAACRAWRRQAAGRRRLARA